MSRGAAGLGECGTGLNLKEVNVVKDKCFGQMFECQGEPKYVAIIPDGPGSCYSGSVWCEGCMGDSFAEGNPYLKLLACQLTA